MMEIQQNIWDETIEGWEPNYEKLFASKVWKQSLLPWLKAQREVKLRTILGSKDHIEIDVCRGMVLAFEQFMNLPKAIEAHKKKSGETEAQSVPQAATHYEAGLAWDDEEENLT